MKPIEDVTCLIVDYGTFIGLAECMAQKCKKVWYYSPWEQEYVCLERCVFGGGFDSFDRVDDILDPAFLHTIDLAIFPDILYGGMQKLFKELGIAVWGHMGADELELYRTKFLKVLKDVGLPMVHNEIIHGLSKLNEHLKNVEDKWVKINRYRANAETFHHRDWQHSQRTLEDLAFKFGPLKERVTFVVQDSIKGSEDSPVLEVGYDGWNIDGTFPFASFQGYEKKNELYLGSLRRYDQLPEEIQYVNSAMAPVLAQYGYRNFYANEIRIKDGVPYHIDPTNRMAGQTMEHLFHTCTNLPEVIWAGANGEILQPEFSNLFAAEATMHYHVEAGGDGWKTFRIPEEALPFVSLYHCCLEDEAYHIPPHKCDEVGVVIGTGNTAEEAITNLKDNFDLIQGEPLSIEVAGFSDLIEEIEQAESEGVPFSDQKMPDPSIVL